MPLGIEEKSKLGIEELSESLSESHERLDEQTPSGDEEEVFEVGTEDKEEEADGDEDRLETRKDRRRQRGEVIRRNEALEEENRNMQERLNRLEDVASQYETQRQTQAQLLRSQPNGESDDDRELRQVESQQETLMKAYRAGGENLSTDDIGDFSRQARELDDKRQELLFKKNYSKYGNHQAQDPQALANEVIKTQLQAQNPDIYADPKKIAWAKGLFIQKQVEGGIPPRELHDYCMDEARKHFRIPSTKMRTPTAADRHRLSGSSKGGSPDNVNSRKSYRMSEHEKEMAFVLYSDIADEKERNQKWVNTVGKKILEDS